MYIIHNLDTAATLNESTCLEYICIITWNGIFIAAFKHWNKKCLYYRKGGGIARNAVAVIRWVVRFPNSLITGWCVALSDFHSDTSCS